MSKLNSSNFNGFDQDKVNLNNYIFKCCWINNYKSKKNIN